MMRVMVTGGAGFIGSHLTKTLLERDTEVCILDNLSTGKREHVPEGVPFFEVDLTDKDAVMSAVSRFSPTHVCHCAAQSSVKVSVEQPELDATTNITGGIHLLEACRNADVQRIVFSSTGGALYGEVPEGQLADEAWPVKPKSPYAVSKASFELYLDAWEKLHGLPYTTLRYSNVFGPRQDPFGEAGVVAIFSRRLLDNKPLKINALRERGDGGCVRDYVYVADVVAANLAVLDADLPGTFNVCTGVPRNTQQILEALARHAGMQQTHDLVEHTPHRPGDLERSVLDNSLLQTHGWRPQTSLEDGLRQTLDHFR